MVISVSVSRLPLIQKIWKHAYIHNFLRSTTYQKMELIRQQGKKLSFSGFEAGSSQIHCFQRFSYVSRTVSYQFIEEIKFSERPHSETGKKFSKIEVFYVFSHKLEEFENYRIIKTRFLIVSHHCCTILKANDLEKKLFPVFPMFTSL